MTLHGHILCWNEARILPFTIDYWKNAGVDKLFVYDNGSTDGSLDILSKYDWIEVVHFESGGKTDEYILTEMRNTMWKNSKGVADWVIVADCDEVPYCTEGNLKLFLEEEKRAGITVIKTTMHDIVTEKFPEYQEGVLMHQVEGVKFHDEGDFMNKTLTFRPECIDDMKFDLGAHTCHPIGTVKIDECPKGFCIFHFKHCGKEYVLEKSKRIYDNLREDIKRGNGIDWHYKANLDRYDEIRKGVDAKAYDPKRKDAQIYIIGHKPIEYGYWDNSLYTPIQVGSGERYTALRDNTGAHISGWNQIYAENTATFWLWQNRKESDYVGQCQYRRRLKFPEDYDFNELFSQYDVVACMPIALLPSIGVQYMHWHSAADLSLLRYVLEQLYPDYLDDFDNFIMSGKYLFYSNGFIMRSKDYDNYCEFLFGVLMRFADEKGWHSPQDAISDIDQEIKTGKRKFCGGHGETQAEAVVECFRYQRQVFGFLSERLLTLYIRHNFEPNKIYCKSYLTYEGV